MGTLQEMKAKEGDLNYVIQKLLLGTLPTSSYVELNAIIGVLECAKLEFYRCMVVKYEEEKIKTNGDVFP